MSEAREKELRCYRDNQGDSQTRPFGFGKNPLMSESEDDVKSDFYVDYENMSG